MKKVTNAAKSSGFTLIELLIVIAILGVLAVVVLVAINPVQQLARTRDAGRISSVSQLGRALQAVAASSPTGQFPAAADWYTSSGVLSQITQLPALVPNSLGTLCNTNQQNGWCYVVNTTRTSAVVYSNLESNANRSLCGTSGNAWTAYHSSRGRGGIVCTEPTSSNIDTISFVGD